MMFGGDDMVSVDLIREHVRQFLEGAASLDEFEDWLASASWNMHQDSDANAQQLAGALELRLAEYSIGHLDDEGLRDDFALILRQGCPEPVLQVQMFIGPVAAVTSTTNVEPSWSYRLPVESGQRLASATTRTASGRTIRRDLVPT